MTQTDPSAVHGTISRPLSTRRRRAPAVIETAVALNSAARDHQSARPAALAGRP